VLPIQVGLNISLVTLLVLDAPFQLFVAAQGRYLYVMKTESSLTRHTTQSIQDRILLSANLHHYWVWLRGVLGDLKVRPYSFVTVL
jgi:hypothetical protein